MYVPHDTAIEKLKIAMGKSVVDGSLVKVEYDTCQSILSYIDELRSQVKELTQENEDLKGDRR